MIVIIRITRERSDLGKPYAKELERLTEVYDWATKTSIDELSKFVKKSGNTPLYVIGSGGSFSATTFASLLHQEIGTMAKCISPLEFLEYENIDNNCSILIISAGGNNSDILSAFDKAISLKPKNLGILCASINNKLTRKAEKIPNVFTHALKLPTGKDGFLATNSLVATLIWLCRAYVESYSLPYEIPSLNHLVFQGKSEQKFYEVLTEQLDKFHDKETIVVLYDKWGKTSAIDSESKLVEAGLVNVQLSDYRNFAHGRHNWLDKNKKNTCLVALVTPQSRELATKTLKLIPEYTPTTAITTNYDGPIGAIALLVQIFYLVKFFGDTKKIDPGRPGVADFGSKIYHLSIPRNDSNSLKEFEKLALRRKFDNADLSDNTIKTGVNALRKFLDAIKKEKFQAVIFDYDGTLCDPENRFIHPSNKIGELLTNLLRNGIIVGVATGRGKSVRKELQKIIPRNLWSNLLVGYYNCADISTLNDETKPDVSSKLDPTLESFLQFLTEHRLLDNHKIEIRPKQISLESKISAIELIESVKAIDDSNLRNVRIVESSHSVDIIPNEVSKLNLYNFIKTSSPFEILCIGDKGKYPGNDFEILATKYSLSVDGVSLDRNTCWNLAPFGHDGEQAVIDYFNCIVIKNNSFYFNPEKLFS
jgi:fructoselysine-6-P-deglycase FrlB-like protein/hydroxymethylpyrimidine pyrophosphatase-like HAD family hydrolase